MTNPGDTWIQLDYQKEIDLQGIEHRWTGTVMYHSDSGKYLVVYPFTGFEGAGRGYTLKAAVEVANKSVEYALEGRRVLDHVHH